ncbi:amidohydrolase family protein [Polymorphospora rubra]|nr:amidohydrolase family protein [Polymorphospora rubra]
MIKTSGGREMFVLDCHAHVGHNSLMRRFTGGKREKHFADEAVTNSGMLGIDAMIAFPVSNPHTDYSVDNQRVLKWAEEFPKQIIPFIRLQPHFEDKAVADVHRYAAGGARGIKLHPRLDGGYVANDDILVRPIVEAAIENDMVMLFHTGETWNASAGLLGDLATRYPEGKFICGHMGMLDSYHDAVAYARRLDNFWLDTTDFWPPTLITKAVRELGPEKVVFGTDTPYIPAHAEMTKLISGCDLTDDELALVMGGNLARVFGLDTTSDSAAVPVPSASAA